MTGEKIILIAEAYIERGTWYLSIKGPRWVLVDIVARMDETKTLRLANGPGFISGMDKLTQSSSILMGTTSGSTLTTEDESEARDD